MRTFISDQIKRSAIVELITAEYAWGMCAFVLHLGKKHSQGEVRTAPNGDTVAKGKRDWIVCSRLKKVTEV